MGRLRPMTHATDGTSSDVSCVLWCANEPPRELLGSLARKGVAPTLCRSAFGAMAEVCLMGSIGQGPGGGGILLIAEPSEVRGKRALLNACQHYAPWLRLWVFQAEAPIQLRPLDMHQLGLDDEEQSDAIPISAPPHRGGADIQTKPRKAQGSPWTPRLSGEGPGGGRGGAVSSDSRAGSEVGHRPAGLLSDEELGMLLSDESDDG